MGRKLYVGNLPYSANQQILQETFGQCGTVDSVNVITNRDTGQSKGFAFVEMSSDSEAQKAIQELNGSRFYSTIQQAMALVGDGCANPPVNSILRRW